MSLSMDSMYQQIILDHYKNPQHRGDIEPFDAEVHHVNPTCGDEVTLRVRVADGEIAELGWIGEGCSISQASTSVMSDLVVGTPVDEALHLQEKFLELMQSQGHSTLSEDDAEALDDAVAFEGVSKYPARVKCALLGWMAMKSAVAAATIDPVAAATIEPVAAATTNSVATATTNSVATATTNSVATATTNSVATATTNSVATATEARTGE